MEDTLGATAKCRWVSLKSLNPCFNGRYSRRREELFNGNDNNVLILVLMEDTLGGDYLNACLANDTKS